MMRKQITLLTLVLTILLAGALPVLAAADTTAALAYMQTQQNSDGGFGSGFSPDSTVSSTADVVLALVAVGADPTTFAKDGNTPLSYLAANAAAARTSGDLAKLVQAAIAAGKNPRDFGGVDSVHKLESLVGADGRIGSDMDTFVSHTLAVLALKSAERTIPPAAVDHLKAAQQEGGGWAWDGSAETAADTNTTAFAVQALIAAGETADSQAVRNALAYYESIQNEDGGWPYQSPSDFGTDTDANSTAVTIQALIAAGLDPAGSQWTTAEGNSPMAALEALQNESGAFAWQAAIPDDNLLATIQALPAVAGRAFPLATMDVGTPEPVLISMPETGGAVANLALLLVLSGLALAGGGYALRRKR
jgi:LPXTG-motif cell wall-anchored protein